MTMLLHYVCTESMNKLLLLLLLLLLYSRRKNFAVSDESLWYQQDGTNPHYALHVQRYLDQVFPKWADWTIE
jgi:hypothetical protein